MNWHVGVIEGIGFVAFIVHEEIANVLKICNLTTPVPVQDEAGRRGLGYAPWGPEKQGFYLDEHMEIHRDRIVCFGRASQMVVEGCEHAWGRRLIETPQKPPLVVPGNVH